MASAPKPAVNETEIDILDPEFIKSRNLTDEQQARIAELQQEIDDIWSKHGEYKVDDEAWRKMPIFMDEVTEDDVMQNPDVAALQNIKYEDIKPEERAGKLKEQGNKFLIMSLNPEQVNPKNFARAATRCYTDAIGTGLADRKLTSQLYGNRSMAHFVLENFGHGLEDAQKAIMLDKEYAKAYYRGAKCAAKIRKFEIARQLMEYGRKTNPPPPEAALAEFDALAKTIDADEEALKNREKKKKMQARSSAADSSQIVRRMQREGISVGQKPEVSSEQWAQLSANKPYFDEANVLHVPVLILWDEFSQSDFMQDVATDVAIGDVIDDMLPCPWDEKGHYQMVQGLCVYYKWDDGVAMPKYYRVDPDWQLFEILRTSTYVMPGLVPTFHVVPENSPFLDNIKFEKRQ